MRKNIFFLVLIIFCFSRAKAQEHFLLPDQPTKCNKIKEGKFVKEGIPAKEWFIEIKNNVQKEYYNNRKEYVKHRLEFTDDCHYKTVVTGKSDSKNPLRTGDFINYEIVETDHQFLKIRSTNFNKTDELILEKIE